ncbi:hypothetical protein [Streptomyces sp. NBC_00539]|uniref:hypothetical protein n=1 Tax=Streptomyces sp. NBC_00539 TaxID=2975770 RepID=UPI003FCD6060
MRAPRAQRAKGKLPLYKQVLRGSWFTQPCPRCLAKKGKGCLNDDGIGNGPRRQLPHDERLRLIINERKRQAEPSPRSQLRSVWALPTSPLPARPIRGSAATRRAATRTNPASHNCGDRPGELKGGRLWGMRSRPAPRRARHKCAICSRTGTGELGAGLRPVHYPTARQTYRGLGWKPKATIAEGVTRYVKWLQDTSAAAPEWLEWWAQEVFRGLT